MIATRDELDDGAAPLQMNGVLTNSRLRQHLYQVVNYSKVGRVVHRVSDLKTLHVAPSPIGVSSHSNSSLKLRSGCGAEDS